MKSVSYCARVCRVGNSLAVFIPKNLAEYLELEPGERVIVRIERAREQDGR